MQFFNINDLTAMSYESFVNKVINLSFEKVMAICFKFYNENLNPKYLEFDTIQFISESRKSGIGRNDIISWWLNI